MTAQSNSTELSEVERIEVRRRIDVAFAVMQSAAPIFTERAEAEKKIERESKESFHYWCFGVLIVFLVVDYFIRDTGQSYTWATGVAFAAFGLSTLRRVDVFLLRRHCYRLNERLSDLEVTWVGARGYCSEPWYGSFGGIKNLAASDGLTRGAEFDKWWLEQYAAITQNVLGIR